jgi:predicted GNAT family acetyltransferase
MKVEQQQSGQDGSFYIQNEGHRIAESRYMVTGDDIMDIYHTEVSENFQGQHLGDDLIKSAVEFAREHNLKIAPSCSFAQAMFGRHPEFRDVQAKS